MDPFNPNRVSFNPVSSKLATVRILGAAVILVLPALGLAVVAAFADLWLLFLPLALVLVFVWLLWLIPRQVGALQYATGGEELFIRRGILFRRLDVIPYGRIQYAEVKQGPVARRFDIAEVVLHTASAQTNGTVPGLTTGDAATLRSLLVSRGGAGLSGL